MEKPKKIDAVRLVRRIRDTHYQELKKASREERIAFYNSKVRPSRQRTDTSSGANPHS
jgi:hypothetical protein